MQQPQVFYMFPLGPGINEYVVYEDYDKLIQEWPEDPIHIVMNIVGALVTPKGITTYS